MAEKKKDPFGISGAGFGTAPGEVPTVNLAGPPVAPPKKGEPKKKQPEPQGPSLDPNALAYDNEQRGKTPPFGALGSQLGVAGGRARSDDAYVVPKDPAQAAIFARAQGTAGLQYDVEAQRKKKGDAEALAPPMPGQEPQAAPHPGGGMGAPTPEHEQWKVGPTVRGLIGEADQLHRKAIDDAEAGNEGDNIANQAALFAQQQKAEAHAEEMRKKELDRAAQTKSYMEQYETLAADVTSTKLDNDRWWSSRNTGQQIASYVGMALHGFLEGIGKQGPSNFIQDAIDRDIDNQKHDIAQRQNGAEKAKNLYGMALQRFGDERAADAAAHGAALAAAEFEIKRRMASTASQKERDRLEMLRADLADKRAQLASQMLQYIPAGYGGGSAMSGSLGGVDRSMYVDLGDGTGIMARTAKEGEDLRALQGRSAQIVGIIGQLKQMDAGASWVDKSNPLSQYNRQRSGLVAQAQQDLTVLQGQGAMSKGDQEVANQAIGGAHRFTNNGAVYDQAAGAIQRGVQNRIVSQGGMRVQEQYQQKGGHVVPMYTPIGPGPRAPQAGGGGPPPGVRVVGQQ